MDDPKKLFGTELERRAAFMMLLSNAQNIMGLTDVEFAAQLMEVAMELGPELFSSSEEECCTSALQ